MNHQPMTNASAIFVDMENMANGQKGNQFDISQIMAYIGSSHPPILRKAYGNWGRFAKYQSSFTEAAFDLVQLSQSKSGKNGLDIHLTTDALEAIFLFPHLTTIFLVTGDSDYCPLVRKLRKHGRQVIGVAWAERTGEVFQQHCDEFRSYDEIIAALDSKQQLLHSENVKQLISQAFTELGHDKWISISILKTVMLRHDPMFDEKQYGFIKFSQFVDAHPDLKLKFSEEQSNYLVCLSINGNGSKNGKH